VLDSYQDTECSNQIVGKIAENYLWFYHIMNLMTMSLKLPLILNIGREYFDTRIL